MTRSVDILLCLWFVLCAVAFWGPYFGVALSPGLSSALYAAFLLCVIAIVAVRWLQSRTAAEKAAKEADGEIVSSEKGERTLSERREREDG